MCVCVCVCVCVCSFFYQILCFAKHCNNKVLRIGINS